MASYHDVIADLRRRGDSFHRAAAELEQIAGTSAPEPKAVRKGVRAAEKRIKRLRAQLSGSSGTSAIVLDLLKDGPKSLIELTVAAKVKASSARTALLALEQAGRVKREGKSRATKYRLTKAK